MSIYTHKRLCMIFMYSVAHFLVDFACAFLMFRSIAETQDWHLCVLLYNFCAFAMQMPLGIIADKINRNFLFAIIGCIFVGTAYGLLYFPIAAAVILGLGNGMFHIGGGIDVLNISEKKSGALGVFVSPGAFGIYFGTIAGRENDLSAIPVLLLLLATAGLIFIFYLIQGGTYPKNAEFSLKINNIKNADSTNIFISVICLFIVVCLRSYVGLTLNFPWKKSTGYWGIALVCAVVLGKTAGGFAADRFGIDRIVLVSLGIAALLFLFPQIPLAGITSVLLFNMTMPITLWAMAKIFPGAKGFSFGLLTFGLFIGFIPVYIGINAAFWLFTPAAIVSLILLLSGFRKAKIKI